MKIKKGDTIKIMTGKDRGKTGKVINIDTQNKKITIEGLNVYVKHSRPKRQGEKGEVVKISRPMDVSNVLVVCPNCKQPTRLGLRLEKDNKFRYCKKCQSRI